MLSRTYPDQVCSIARALEVVGERWTLLVLRDCLLGLRRFDEFVESLGIARNTLTNRLQLLLDEGLLERRPATDSPGRQEYVLTRKGAELSPVLIQMMKWGDRYYAPDEGVPRLTLHRGCGGQVDKRMVCRRCRDRVHFRDVELQPGPGLEAALNKASA